MHMLLADPSQPKQAFIVAMMSIPIGVAPLPTRCFHTGLSPCPLAVFVFVIIGQLEKAEAYANAALLGDISHHTRQRHAALNENLLVDCRMTKSDLPPSCRRTGI
jgi:hypothetical protein